MGVLIDTGILSRVIRIRYGKEVGTAVVFGSGNMLRAIVTAGHLLKGAAPGDRIALRHKDDWGFVTIADIGWDPNGADVCVAVPTTQWGEGLPIEQLNAEVLVGEDVAFCGFPLGLEMSGVIEPAYPTPLVKGGMFSGAIDLDGNRVCLFDAINNRGFSGGPIVRRKPQDGKNYIVGIVSGYKYDAPMFVSHKDEKGEERASNEYYIRGNSGFMYGVGAEIISRLIQVVVERALAERNINGLAIKD